MVLASTFAASAIVPLALPAGVSAQQVTGIAGGVLAAATSGDAGTGGSSPDAPANTRNAGGSAASDPGKAGKAPSTPAQPSAKRSRGASPARPTVTLTAARCVPQAHCSARQHYVSQRGDLQLQGAGLRPGMLVLFPAGRMARISARSPRARIARSKTLGLIVQVPGNAHSGRILVMAGRGVYSNAFGPIYVVSHALHPPAPKPKKSPKHSDPSGPTSASGTAFAGEGMWIWELPKTDGGNLAAIAEQAHKADIATLFIKSSDGGSYWSQFSPQLVSTLHADGFKVCAWQYVYGTNPLAEANAGAEAVANGADCLVIDAESQYEGHYTAADRYLEALRAKIGASYPLGLTSFPYVDYHETFPYSVFLGPDGAQFNVPQMYWKAIGISVGYAYVHTFQENLIYRRPICPLGQTYENPTAQEIVTFRSLAAPYDACGGVSWWDWQETSARDWSALAAPLESALTIPQPELTAPLLKSGARGDQVLWLQEHLAAAYPSQPTNGVFEGQTVANVKAFQSAHGLPASGETDPVTWADALALTPVVVHWTGSGPSD